MFNFAVSRESLLSGFQWFFFIFCNTVVVPPTLLSAFQLPQSSLLTLTQYAFLATALACFAQAFCGHRRAIMEAGRPVVGNHPDYHPWRSIARDTDQRYRYQSGGGNCALRRADDVDWF